MQSLSFDSLATLISRSIVCVLFISNYCSVFVWIKTKFVSHLGLDILLALVRKIAMMFMLLYL